MFPGTSLKDPKEISLELTFMEFLYKDILNMEDRSVYLNSRSKSLIDKKIRECMSERSHASQCNGMYLISCQVVAKFTFLHYWNSVRLFLKKYETLIRDDRFLQFSEIFPTAYNTFLKSWPHQAFS